MKSVGGNLTRSVFLKLIGLTGLSTIAALFRSSDPHTRTNDSKNLKNVNNKKRGKKAAILTGKLGLKPENIKHY